MGIWGEVGDEDEDWEEPHRTSNIIFGRTDVQYQSESLGAGGAEFEAINDAHAKVSCGLGLN